MSVVSLEQWKKDHEPKRDMETGLFPLPNDDKVWACECGNQQFYWAVPGYLFCPECGAQHELD